MSEPVLALRGVHKSYDDGNLPILQGVDFSLMRGEMVGLIAPSGAGKSTLLHITGLLDVADQGEVWVNGVDCSRLDDQGRTAQRRNDIGFIYQFHHLLPEFSALENVVLPQLAAGEDKKPASGRAQQLLETVGLAARTAHRPASLSGGEQQRVAFCRALANRPSILLADEPTGNLDPSASQMVFEQLQKLVHAEGVGAFIATHNHELAARMDRIVRLEDQRLVEA